MTTTFSPTSPTSSSPPLSPDLSKDDSQPFHITVDRSSAITHPFPSPGSAFVPPPKPGVHEFTLPQTKRSKKNNSASPSSASAPGSGTTTPNNVSSSSIAQSSRSPAMMDIDSAPLSNGTAVPSDHKASDNERIPAPGIRPTSECSSSQPQPYSQLTSTSASSISPGSDTMPTASNTVSSKTSALSLGSGRATPTPSNTAGNHNTTTTNSIPRTSSSSSASSKQTQTALSSSRPAPPSPTPSRAPSQSRGGSRRQSRLSSASGTGASPSNSPMNTTTTNGTTTPSKRLSTLSNLSVGSNPNQNKRLSTLSNISTLPTVPQSQVAPSAMTPTTSASALPSTTIPLGQILIRDFAFPITDKRHTGEGADAPKVIKKMQKKYGPPGIRKPERGRDSTSASASSSGASSESGSRRGSGFGFGWGTNAGGWWSGVWSGFGSGNRSGSGSRTSKAGGIGVAGREDEDLFTPTLNDLTRNFTSSSSPTASQPASPAVAPQTIGSYDDDDDDAKGAETPLLPGLYKALYDFMPEGTAEMGLREGDIVRVAGEGGGVGWAVVVRGTIRFTEDGEEIIDYADGGGVGVSNDKSSATNEVGARTEDMWALVPESYLEVWRLDRTDDDEGQLGDDEKLEDRERESGLENNSRKTT